MQLLNTNALTQVTGGYYAPQQVDYYYDEYGYLTETVYTYETYETYDTYNHYDCCDYYNNNGEDLFASLLAGLLLGGLIWSD